MNQLPIFVTLKGRKVILVGEGDAADAKRRLIERAGGICVGADSPDSMLAFVALDDREEGIAVAQRLKAKGLLVNVVDQPDHCDFTTPAIVDRDPVLVAIGTGGASAGLAKAVRQRLEALLPQGIGDLAKQLSSAREQMRARWPVGAERRKAIDDALSEAGILDPLAERGEDAVNIWLKQANGAHRAGVVLIILTSTDPDDLTLRQARLMGQADHIYHDGTIPTTLLDRARADAVRHIGAPPSPLPDGLIVHLQLQSRDGGLNRAA